MKTEMSKPAESLKLPKPLALVVLHMKKNQQNRSNTRKIKEMMNERDDYKLKKYILPVYIM